MTVHFNNAVREVVLKVDKGGRVDAVIGYRTIKDLLEREGLKSGCYTEKYDGPEKMGPESPEQIARWYAGQYLDIVENEAWFAMNSLINCLDSFCPKV